MALASWSGSSSVANYWDDWNWFGWCWDGTCLADWFGEPVNRADWNLDVRDSAELSLGEKCLADSQNLRVVRLS